MLGSSSSVASSLALALALSSVACGLRSDPFAPDFVLDSDGMPSDDDDGDPNRAGTCTNPIGLPFSPTIMRGELSGPSFSEGWCGSDGGPEDVYLLVPDYDVDVILTYLSGESDPEFTPTLRVVENGCEASQGITRVCTRSFADDQFHFLARAGNTYAVVIDTPDGGEGRYAFSVDFGWPTIDTCDPHPEVIEQIPGSAFLWNNDFTEGQGRVDGFCGGPGRENMFPLQASYPGNMFARVETSGAFAPVLSLRTDCAALSELSCNSAGAGGITELGYYIPQAGLYYLVVDQGQIGAGGYSLRVDFE
ncbi:hypothetical protein [Paraliomyxa miuraensis]|uniref:hypothetical protein n=1 Tax=Paraliomyxa miuraensis TaxID=376150 RepID=UPI00224D2850|nr:hypothetical protein [Paraliomyxa miuraensis]MCX4244636.1 hypothetical protein [Paraliomyxa miuraensis]